MRYKKIACIVFLFLYVSLCVAANTKEEKSWYLLERGQIALEKKDFGNALLYANAAREVHTKDFTAKYEYLTKVLKARKVRAAGDSIEDVYHALQSREDFDACKIIDEIRLIHSDEFFHKSISAFMDWLKKRICFPESDYFTGFIYEVEGDYGQAMIFYKQAWENRDFLDIPEQRFQIIYSLANISSLLKKYDDQEKYLLLVLTEDPVYGTTNLDSPTLKSMLYTIKSQESVEKFFHLYRHYNDMALRAYKGLADIYIEHENYERAFTVSAIAANIAVSMLSRAMEKSEFTYTYKDFSDLLLNIGENPVLVKWADQKNVWEILLQFADLLYKTDNKAQAKDLYSKLAKSAPSEEFNEKAEYKLNTKF